LNDCRAADWAPRPRRVAAGGEVERAGEAEQVGRRQPIAYRRGEEVVLTAPGRVIFNVEVERSLREAQGLDEAPEDFPYVNTTLSKKEVDAFISELAERYGAQVIADVLDTIKALGFKYATDAGVTISKNDIVIPESKEKILDELNPIFMMANSGARGSFKQIRQLAGMRGLMANPKGEIIERPIKANFMEGLSVLEYFISTHGARKGLADTALRTADSGYLTRRLVDVAQDVIVRAEDCGTKEHIGLPVRNVAGDPNAQMVGRFAAEQIKTKRGRVLAEKDEIITREALAEIVEAYGDEQYDVPVRSVLKCEAESGICQRCYGIAPATGKLVAIGDAVGII